MPGQDRNRRGRGLGNFTRLSNTLGPNDPRIRRIAQAGGTQRYVEEPLYIEGRNRARGGSLDGGVLKINIDSSTQAISGGKVVVKPGTVVPAAHAPSHTCSGSDPLTEGAMPIKDSSNCIVVLDGSAAAGDVNHVEIVSAPIGSNPVISTVTGAGPVSHLELTADSGFAYLPTAIIDAIYAGTLTPTRVIEPLDGGSENWSVIESSATGDPVVYGADGDTDLDVLIRPQGVGVVLIGTDAAANEAATIGTTQTFTNKTLTTPKIATILDLNGNEWIQVSAAGSAVNQLEIVNSATGNPVEIQPAGGDANIPIRIDPKGTGAVIISTLTTGALIEETTETGITADGIRIKDGSVWHRRQMWQYTDPNTNAAPIAIGTPVATLAGTTVANSNTERPWLIHIVNPGVSGGVISPNFVIVMRNWFPHFECRIKTHTNITSNQYWAGFMSADTAGTADPNTLHVAAFRYSTDVDGTLFWRTYTAGGAAASTATATGTAIATDTQYVLRVEMDSGEVRFYIDNVLVDTSTTNLPGAATMLGYGIRVHHLGAVGTKRIYWPYIGVHCDQ